MCECILLYAILKLLHQRFVVENYLTKAMERMHICHWRPRGLMHLSLPHFLSSIFRCLQSFRRQKYKHVIFSYWIKSLMNILNIILQTHNLLNYTREFLHHYHWCIHLRQLSFPCIHLCSSTHFLQQARKSPMAIMSYRI